MTDPDELDWRIRSASRERQSAVSAACLTARLAHQRLADLYGAPDPRATDLNHITGARHDRA